jgi:hypothetical protein
MEFTSELARSLHQTEHGMFGVRCKNNKRRASDFCDGPHLRETAQGAILVLATMEALMMHRSFRRSPTAEERRVVRNWAWYVLIVYSAVVLAAFGLVTLSQRLANESKDPAAAQLTATADGNQRAR